jgi:hypothetical protein
MLYALPLVPSASLASRRAPLPESEWQPVQVFWRKKNCASPPGGNLNTAPPPKPPASSEL